MSRLTALKPRMKQAEGRQYAEAQSTEAASGWGSGRGGRPWRRKRETILVRDNYTCQVCGLVTLDLEVDHVINIAQGGTDDEGNLQSLCVPCHKVKTAAESAAGSGYSA